MKKYLLVRLFLFGLFILSFCNTAGAQALNFNYTNTSNGNWTTSSIWSKGTPSPTSGSAAEPVYVKNNINLDASLTINSGVYVIGAFGKNSLTGGVYSSNASATLNYCSNNSLAALPTSVFGASTSTGDTIQWYGNLQSISAFGTSSPFNNTVSPVTTNGVRSGCSNSQPVSKTWTITESTSTQKTAYPIVALGGTSFTYPTSSNALQVLDPLMSVSAIKTLFITNGQTTSTDFKSLTMSNNGQNRSTSILDIRSKTTTLNNGSVVNFEGGATLSGSNLMVRSGSTLVLGPSACAVCEQSGSLAASPATAIAHTQSVASMTWTIPNSLSITRPAVMAINATGTRLFPTSVTISGSNIVVTFATAVSGSAVVRTYNYVLQAGDNMTEADRAKLCTSASSPCTQTRLSLSNGSRILVEPNAEIKIYGSVVDSGSGSRNYLTLNGLITVVGDYKVVRTAITSGTGTNGTLTTTGQIFTNTTSTRTNVFGSTNDCLLGPCSSNDLGCPNFTALISPEGSANLCAALEVSGLKTQSALPATSVYYRWDYAWQASASPYTGWTTISGVTVTLPASPANTVTGSITGTSTNNAISTTPYTLTKITVPTTFDAVATPYVRLSLKGTPQSGSSRVCTDTSPVLTLAGSSGTDPIWLGKNNNILARNSASADWRTASNWCPAAVPGTTSNVTLAPGDEIDVSGGTANVLNLNIYGNDPNGTIPGKLTIGAVSTGTLNIYGDLNINAGTNPTPDAGTFTNTAGSVYFNGGVTGTPASFNNFGIYTSSVGASSQTFFTGFTQITNDPAATITFSVLNVGVDGTPSGTGVVGTKGYLKINPGTTVKITNGIRMPLNNATLDAVGSTIEMPTSTSNSTITVDASGMTFGNIVIDRLVSGNYSLVNITKPLNVAGSININSGILNTNNNLTLLSQGAVDTNGGDIGILTDGDAQIGKFGASGFITGNVTAQRKLDALPAGAYAYRYLGSPVSMSAPPVSPMLDGFYGSMTGAFAPGDGMVYNSATLSTVSFTGALFGTTQTLSTSGTPASVSALQGGSKTWSFTTTGWKLIGNPYPASIIWNNTDWTQGAAASFASIMAITDNHVTNVYPSYFRYADNSAPSWGSGYVQNNIIAMGQGFWVYVQTASVGTPATLTVTENAKTSTVGKFYRTITKADPFDQLRIGLEDEIATDHIFLRVPNQRADEQQPDTRSIGKLFNKNLNVYFAEGQTGASLIKYLEGNLKDISIPLGIEAKGAGTYNFRFDFSDHAPEYLENLYLIDAHTGQSIRIAYEQTYQFDLADASRPVLDRFKLSSRPYNSEGPESEFQVGPNPVSGLLNMKFPEGLTVQTSIFGIRGELIHQAISSGSYVFDFSALPSGMYLINFKSEKGDFTKKIIRE